MIVKVRPETERCGWQMKRIIYIAQIVIAALLLLSGCREAEGIQSDTIIMGAAAEQAKPDYDTEITAVVKEINTAEKTITLFDLKSQEERILTYTGGTDITDKYGQITSISLIRLGEIVDAFYQAAGEKLMKMQISKTAWEYNGVDRFRFNKTKKILEVAENKYRYTENLIVSDGEKQMLLMDVNDKDELTLKGVDEFIYSVTVTKGHGYIRLSNYDAFVGGDLEVGYDIFTTISDNMLLVVREGKYDVTLKKGELQGRKTVNVAAGQEVTVDMGEYYVEPERVGHVKFTISPEGADLYIDKTLTDYEEDAELAYGKYDIRVSMEGYEDWTGVLNVASSYEPIEIFLANKKAENVPVQEEDDGSVVGNENEVTEAENEEPSEEPTPETEDRDIIVIPSPSPTPLASGKVTEDKDHTITILSPVGMQIYVDGTFKGVTPMTFPKMIGNLTITLCGEGYVNKSFSVETTDDKKDVQYRFPDLVKSNG